jgi:hypothetical protein
LQELYRSYRSFSGASYELYRSSTDFYRSTTGALEDFDRSSNYRSSAGVL